MPRVESHADDKNLVAAFKKVLASGSSGASASAKGQPAGQPARKIGSPEVMHVALVSSMFQTALCTLTQMRMDILTGTTTRLSTPSFTK